jgi:hypothetical protein
LGGFATFASALRNRRNALEAAIRTGQRSTGLPLDISAATELADLKKNSDGSLTLLCAERVARRG